MRVIFTPLAERQIDRLHEYITIHSGEQRADGFVGRIVARCNGLAVSERDIIVHDLATSSTRTDKISS